MISSLLTSIRRSVCTESWRERRRTQRSTGTHACTHARAYARTHAPTRIHTHAQTQARTRAHARAKGRKHIAPSFPVSPRLRDQRRQVGMVAYYERLVSSGLVRKVSFAHPTLHCMCLGSRIMWHGIPSRHGTPPMHHIPHGTGIHAPRYPTRHGNPMLLCIRAARVGAVRWADPRSIRRGCAHASERLLLDPPSLGCRTTPRPTSAPGLRTHAEADPRPHPCKGTQGGAARFYRSLRVGEPARQP